MYMYMYMYICVYIYIYIYCHGVKNHTTSSVPITAPEGGFIGATGKILGVRVRWCSLCSPPRSWCRVPVLVLSGGCLVTRCCLRKQKEIRERERLATVLLEIQLNSGEIRGAYNATG